MKCEGRGKWSDRKIVILLITYALYALCITDHAANTHIFVFEYKVTFTKHFYENILTAYAA